MFEKELDTIKKAFIKYLDSLGISSKTHKNYRSDLNHFTAWVILKIRSFGSYAQTLSDCVPFLNNDIAKDYRNYLTENKIPVKTINRRLSTLRHFSRFLFSENMTDSNFMDGLENSGVDVSRKLSGGSIAEEYKAFLEAEKASKNTIKNYMSDVKQFLSWLETAV